MSAMPESQGRPRPRPFVAPGGPRPALSGGARAGSTASSFRRPASPTPVSVAEAPSALDINDLRAPTPAWNAAVEMPVEAQQTAMEQGIEPAVEVEAQAVAIVAEPAVELTEVEVIEPSAALSELVEASLAETSEMSPPASAEISVEVDAESAFGVDEFAATGTVEAVIETAEEVVGEVVAQPVFDAGTAASPETSLTEAAIEAVEDVGEVGAESTLDLGTADLRDAPVTEADWAADASAVDDTVASLPDLSDPAVSFDAFASAATLEPVYDRLDQVEETTSLALAPEGLEAELPVPFDGYDDEPAATDADAVIALSPIDHATGERLTVVLEDKTASLDALVEATDAQANALEVLEVMARRIRSGELQVASAGTSEESVLASILAALLSHRP